MTLRKDEYARRRKQLMKLMGKGAIAIIPAAPERQRNSDVHYHYRPDSDFHYLTGFNEPEAAKEFIHRQGAPIVVKADGLAAGKGVIICHNENEAFAAVDSDHVARDIVRLDQVFYGLRHVFGGSPAPEQRATGYGLDLRCA